MFVILKGWRGGKIMLNTDNIVRVESRKGDFTGDEYCVVYYVENGEVTSVEVSGTMKKLQETLNQML